MRETYTTQAIEHSCKAWNVDIITLSFSLQEDSFRVREGIVEAERNGKIIFAAASEYGPTQGPSFPASHPGVICIHATDADGNLLQHNRIPFGSNSNSNFSILGQHIESCWPDAKRVTGSSYAVPVAVALAAFMIGYVQQEDLDLDTPVKLKSNQGIAALFRLLVKVNRQRGGNGWLAPFNFFQLPPPRIGAEIADSLKSFTYANF